MPYAAGTATANGKSEGPFAGNIGPLGDMASGPKLVAHGRSQALPRPPICPAGTPSAGQIGERGCRHGSSKINAAAMTTIGYKEQPRGIARCASCRTDYLSASSEMSPWALLVPFSLLSSVHALSAFIGGQAFSFGILQPVCISDVSVGLMNTVSCVSSPPSRSAVRHIQ